MIDPVNDPCDRKPLSPRFSAATPSSDEGDAP